METKMHFKADAQVVAASGDDVGQVDRVVIDPRSQRVSHIVVRKGTLFTKDKVVPLDLIQTATEDKIILRRDAGDLQAFPDYEETQFLAPGERDWQSTPEHYVLAPAVYAYPPPLEAAVMGSPRYPGAGATLDIKQNIPEGEVALKEGARVLAKNGEEVGSIKRVLINARSGRVTHFVIGRGLFKEDKVIPADWIAEVAPTEVRLAVSQSVLEQARAFDEKDNRG